jgi:hypothetical protein
MRWKSGVPYASPLYRLFDVDYWSTYVKTAGTICYLAHNLHEASAELSRFSSNMNGLHANAFDNLQNGLSKLDMYNRSTPGERICTPVGFLLI